MKQWAWIILLIAFSSALAIESSLPTYDGIYRALYTRTPHRSMLLEYRPDILDVGRLSFVQDTLIIDFESRQVTFSRFDTFTNTPFWEFHYQELHEYLDDMADQAFHELYRREVREKGRGVRRQERESALTFALPAHLPQWATRIVGTEPPRLTITGTQRIKVGVERSVSGTRDDTGNQRKLRDPIFSPNSDFTIKGTVGRLLEMQITLRGETGRETFAQAADQLDEIRIHYHSKDPTELEDDIIQEVIIGKTSFSMPGLGLIGYPGGGDGGLFGIKVRSKIGPLDLTTIASIENVENEKRTISLQGRSRPQKIGERAYIPNQFFFPDTLLRNIYTHQSIGGRTAVNQYLESVEPPLKEIPTIETIRLFKMIPASLSSTDKVYNVFYDSEKGVSEFSDAASISRFVELRESDDYTLNRRNNWIYFHNRLNDRDIILAVVTFRGGYKPDGLGVMREHIVEVDGEQRVAVSGLATIKRERYDTKVGSPLYPLMMRNVYPISRGGSTNFSFSVNRVNDDGSLSEINDEGKRFDDILGLTKDGQIDRTNEEIFDFTNGFLFMPVYNTALPADRTALVDPLHPFTNPALGSLNGESNTNSAIYDDDSRNIADKFAIETVTMESTTTFNLAFGIREGSETLTSGGVKLVRDVDYRITYFSGQVELLSPWAKSLSSVDASYQRESLFLLDKRRLFGINGMLRFPNLGRNSYLSTTLLWQSVSTRNEAPRIGSEPYNRFGMGANLMLDFSPEWMTVATNRLPGIETTSPSTARLNLEVARTVSRKSSKKDAYVENFSSSAQRSDLGEDHTRWFRASPDYERVRDNPNGYFENPPAWHWYWYRPLGDDVKTQRRDIYVVEENSSLGQQEATANLATLRLTAQPLPDDPSLRSQVTDANGNLLVSPWAGMMRGFTGSMVNRSEDRYFEFWIKPSTSQGRLLIDFGEISKDLSLDGGPPNGREDFEKLSGEVSSAEDLGINALPDSLEVWRFPVFNRSTGNWEWEELGYGDERLGSFSSDPARDNWRAYDSRNLSNRSSVNGTQGNNALYGNFPRIDREDFNGDGRFFPDRLSRFFRYVLPLDEMELEDSPFLDRTYQYAPDRPVWYHIRIPISILTDDENVEVVDEPRWENITQVRLLWQDFTKGPDDTSEVSLEFHGMRFVGNQWTEHLDTASRDEALPADEVGKVVATVVNSKDDPQYRFPDPSLADTIDGQLGTDYSLVLDFNGIEQLFNDSTSAYGVERRFTDEFQRMNFSLYRELHFWACEERHPSRVRDYEISSGAPVWFVFRFGNSDSSFYEYRTRNFPSGGEWNWGEFRVPLDELTRMKLSWFDTYGERDPSGIDTTLYLNDDEALRIYTNTTNAPTLSSIRWMFLGVQNFGDLPYYGRVKVNQIRALGLSDYRGNAVNVGTDFQWADLMRNNLSFSYRDANFRSLAEDVHQPGNSRMEGSMGGEISLDKFTPARLGLRVPLGASVSAQLNRPEMRPNSDIPLVDSAGNPDGFSDMAEDFIEILTGRKSGDGITLSEQYQNQRNTHSIYTGYSKSRESENPIVNAVADRVDVTYRYTRTDTEQRRGIIPEDEKALISNDRIDDFHVNYSIEKRHNFGLKYSLSPRSSTYSKLSLRPFQESENRQIRGLTFNLLPRTIDLGIADVNYQWLERYNSIDEVIRQNYQWGSEERLALAHNINIQYEPIAPILTFTARSTVNRNFDRYLAQWEGRGVGEFIDSAFFKLHDSWGDYMLMFNEESRQQNMNLRFSPNLSRTRWFNVTSSVRGDYSHTVDNASPEAYMRTNVTSGFELTTTIEIRRIFQEVARKRLNEDGRRDTTSFSHRADRALGKVRFDRLRFNYNANMALTNRYITPEYADDRLGGSYSSYMAYKMGIHGRTFGEIMRGDMDDASHFGGVQNRNDWYGDDRPLNSDDRRNTSQTFTVSTTFDIPPLGNLSLSTVSLGWDRRYVVTPEVERFDTTTKWPEIRVVGRSPILQKIGELDKLFRTIDLNSGYQYSRTEQISSPYWVDGDGRSRKTERITLRTGFSPLYRVSGTLRQRPIDLSYGMDLLFDTTRTGEYRYDTLTTAIVYSFQGAQQRVTRDHRWTVGYRKRGTSGRTFTLPNDNVVDVKGDMHFQMNAGFRVIENRFDSDRDNLVRDEDFTDKLFTLSPVMTYDFTDKISFRFVYAMRREVRGVQEFISNRDELSAEVTIRF